MSDALGRVITFGLDQFSSYHTQQLFLFRKKLRLFCQIQKRSGIVDLHFRVYEFEQEDRPLFVFVSIQEDKAPVNESLAAVDWNTRGRLLAAWHGQRNLGQRLLELAVKGFDDFSQARDALKKTVETTVERLTD